VESRRWQELDVETQMANVGSEVGRAFKWRAKGNAQLAEGAFWRGLELLDATLADPKNLVRSREIRRARELFCSVYYRTGEYNETPERLEEYFMQFARQVRNR
jgi:hypothetical protein